MLRMDKTISKEDKMKRVEKLLKDVKLLLYNLNHIFSEIY